MNRPEQHVWVKSSYSNQDGGNCVEWAPRCVSSVGAVPVRDSKVPDGPVVLFGREAFMVFVAAAKGSRLGM